MCLAALSSRGTLVLEAALRSALLALERALAEEQRQRGACGLCAPCLFPPCANLTRHCPRESRLPGPHGPIPRTPYTGPRVPTQTLPRVPIEMLPGVPIQIPPHAQETLPKHGPMPGDPTQILFWLPTKAPPHPLEILPK